MNADKKNPKMKVGYFDGGIVFNVPANIKGKKIRVTVTNENNGKKYCDYEGLA